MALEQLSGSTNGRGIKITATSAGAAQTLHSTGTTDPEDIRLQVRNELSQEVVLTILWGGTTNPDDYLEFTIPANKQLYTFLAQPLFPSGSALDVKAFADQANALIILGTVQVLTS